MEMLTIDIRRATPDDANGIADVHADAWRFAYTGVIPHRALTGMINRRGGAWWDRAIRRGTSIYLVGSSDTVFGYVTFGLNRARALRHEGEVYELYLLPEYHGMGLGKRLFQEARQSLLAHGCEGLVVWSLKDNERACEFYSDLGGKDAVQGRETFDGQTLEKIGFLWD
ncbi:MAG: GNAT family N-acetyltransferase [Pseudomonadota bacterium]